MKAMIITFVGLLILTNSVLADVDKDREVAVTCAVISESRNMDSAFRVERVNQAREKIGAEPYLLGDDLIKLSIELGTCELLVSDRPGWVEVTRLRSQELSARVQEAAEAERIAADIKWKVEEAERKTYRTDFRILFLPNTEIADSEKYKTTELTLQKSIDISRAYEGETVTGSLSGYYADCIVPLFDHSKTVFGGWTFSLKKNIPLCREIKSPKEQIYTADYFTVTMSSGNSDPMGDAFILKKEKGKISICSYASGYTRWCTKNKTMEDFIFGIGFVYLKQGAINR